MQRPIPKNEEIKLDPHKMIVSKTDLKGTITYVNDVFIDVCGYSQSELIGMPHNIVRHPDMPKIAFKLMWDTINQGKNFRAVVKNLAKDGRYYWVVTDFEPLYDAHTKQIITHTAYRMPAPKKAKETMAPIYAKLVELEKSYGMDGSLRYLMNFLDENKTTYDDFIGSLIGEKQNSDNSGLAHKMGIFFKYIFRK